MSEIPMDARILKEQFLAEQKKQEAKKAMGRNSLIGRVSFGEARKPMKAKEIQRYARNLGFAVEEGRGRHGMSHG